MGTSYSIADLIIFANFLGNFAYFMQIYSITLSDLPNFKYFQSIYIT